MIGQLINWRSDRAGVRWQDGSIVFVIPTDEVMVDERGCRALLHAPELECAQERHASRETLKHCRIAAKRGKAVGLLAGDRSSPLTAHAIDLRVEKLDGRYWAKWRRNKGAILSAREFDAASVRLLRDAVAAMAGNG